MKKRTKSFLEQLTQLQIKQGFLPNTGVLSPISILGYVGEAGEVAGEIDTPREEFTISAKLAQVMYSARSIDNIKKDIRNKEIKPIAITVRNPDSLKAELADHFYFMNAVCIELGITHEELAELALNKELNYLNGKEPVKHSAPIGKPGKTAPLIPAKQVDKPITPFKRPEPEMTGQTCSMEEGCLSCGS